MEGKTGAENGLKLFGVTIVDGVRWKREEDEVMDMKGDEKAHAMKKGMPKSKSMVNLMASAATLSGDYGAGNQGYLSDGGLPQSSRRREGQERKRGVPWTEDEHRTFLAGLEKLGKGDWRGISRNFVTTRTPTQVASHAQKYFLRQNNPNRKKRRSSLFDVVITSKATNSETPPTSPLNKSDETVKATVHLGDNHPSAGPSSFSLYQRIFPISSSCNSRNLHKTSSMEQVAPTLSLIPSIATQGSQASTFPQISVPICPQALTKSATTSNGDLELSIAPPQSHNNMATLSSGTIRVV